jgi:hypothetical protein
MFINNNNIVTPHRDTLRTLGPGKSMALSPFFTYLKGKDNI